mmetsp:Transcript_54235/g.123597  ORF Transcript_54235/g.123597 Transcript_54235/m.123597 type:complete len:246 (-) Transcript_54235:273-1010(-)
MSSSSLTAPTSRFTGFRMATARGGASCPVRPKCTSPLPASASSRWALFPRFFLLFLGFFSALFPRFFSSAWPLEDARLRKRPPFFLATRGSSLPLAPSSLPPQSLKVSSNGVCVDSARSTSFAPPESSSGQGAASPEGPELASKEGESEACFAAGSVPGRREGRSCRWLGESAFLAGAPPPTLTLLAALEASSANLVSLRCLRFSSTAQRARATRRILAKKSLRVQSRSSNLGTLNSKRTCATPP